MSSKGETRARSLEDEKLSKPEMLDRFLSPTSSNCHLPAPELSAAAIPRRLAAKADILSAPISLLKENSIVPLNSMSVGSRVAELFGGLNIETTLLSKIFLMIFLSLLSLIFNLFMKHLAASVAICHRGLSVEYRINYSNSLFRRTPAPG
jgi:hypothetical protein